MDWILWILVLTGMASSIYLVWRYFHHTEEFVASIGNTDKEPAEFIQIGIQEQEPIRASENAYFTEQVTIQEVKTALALSVTAKIENNWGDMYEVSKKEALKSKAQVISTIEESLNTLIRTEDAPFKVKGAIPLHAVSHNGLPDLFYCKWDIVAHRGNKLFGFGFEATFLHMQDMVQLCEFTKISQITEDVVETITKLPDMKN